MKSILVLAFLLSGHQALAKPGDLVNVLPLSDLTYDDFAAGWCAPNSSITQSVKRYKITYETTDTKGGETNATGVLMVPQNSGNALPILSYQHGTITDRDDSVSQEKSYEAEVVGTCYAPLGFVVVAADYLGLGDSTLPQAWLVADSEASSAADLLLAVRQAAAQLNIVLSDQLFLTGFSQGGHATLALQRYLEAQVSSGFQITASAPIAGPTDLENLFFKKDLQNISDMSPFQSAFLVYTMNSTYGTPSDLNNAFLPTVASTLNGTFNETITLGAMPDQFPDSPAGEFQSSFINEMQTNESNPFLQSLRQNQVYDWKPIAPVKLYHGENDNTVVIDNSRLAYNTMKQLGANVELVDLGPVDHQGCISPAFSDAATWFLSLLK